ncbi:MAG: PBP1A family penicillin-binding protein [Nitrospirae bacterium]|nr:PBP1A family penicillin-binding protein [Nitrospirota bacterium]
MSVPIVIFSIDDTRGKLLQKVLLHDGLHSKLITRNFELGTVLNRHVPSIVIFDTKNYYSRDFDYLRNVCRAYPAVSVVALAEDSLVPVLIGVGVRSDLCIREPFNPELILLKTRELVFFKNKVHLKVKTYLSLMYHLIMGDRDNRYILFVKKVLLVIAILGSALAGLAGGFTIWSLSDLPKVQQLEDYSPLEVSSVYSADGLQLAEFYYERRKTIPYYKIPPHVKNAFLAVEDARFYEHRGIDLLRIGGAFLENLRSKGYAQGGSTITQQLAKMLFLKPEKSLSRKVREVVLSLQIENRYTKDEILGIYLNQAYFGARSYGIEAAAQTYFGKKTEDLSIADAALMAALPKAPSSYSPFKYPERSLSRRNLVLKMMLNRGYINDDKYKAALAEPLPVETDRPANKSTYFVDYLKSHLEKQIGEKLFTGGLKIQSTLDSRMQEAAGKAVKKGISVLTLRGGKDIQAALLAVDIKTGSIRAMAGGLDYSDSVFNRATQAMRQPGSAFKPFVYLTAFKEGYTPEDIIMDKEVTYFGKNGGDQWTPQNYTRRFYGNVTLRTAIASSLNGATIYLANKLGMQKIIDTARSVGITSSISPHLPSAIGASDLSLIEMVYAYATMAGGLQRRPVFYTAIKDKNDVTLETDGLGDTRVIDDKSVSRMRDVLQAVVQHGTATAALSIGRPVYGKTGTTNDYTDAWFVGFDDRLAVGVWVGRDDNKPMGQGFSGSAAALPIWIDFMKSVGGWE